MKQSGVMIIAEAGVNHNGNIDLAKLLVDAACDSGADVIKFQTFKADHLVSATAAMADYQVRNTEKTMSQLDMLKELELTYEHFETLKDYCELKGIMFLSTPFDDESIDFLDALMPIYKIPSGEINNFPYLKRVASKSKPVILSTGMATLADVEKAISALRSVQPDIDITLLHCTTNYPAPFEEVNLRAMSTLGMAFKVNVGYSDHTLGVEIPLAAVAMGAAVIEKHFTLDKSMQGPDHRISLEPSELKSMVNMIRNIECAMGDGIKKPNASEIKIMASVRKSIVAGTKLQIGDTLTSENLVIKRPGTGIPPECWDDVLGKRVNTVVEKDTLMTWNMLL